ncbi:MAG: Ku protein, partial [Planctomycetota bacterium]|nr:Ku protein [Planctomycetota bacterium]
MAPRTSWKGFLKLSLVSVPVRAFTAHETSEEIRLNQLHKDCHNRVRYKKVCPEHGELKNDQIVSGYEYAKDQYVVIDPEELQKLRPESDKTVAIEGFIKVDEIDPIFFAGKTYYLLPDGVAGNRPYALLHRGMLDAGVVALARFVMSGRDQLVVIRPVEDLLAISVLNYAKSVKKLEAFREELEEQETTAEELKLAETLIDATRIDDFDLQRYTDSYADNLHKLIKMKIDGEEVVSAPEPEEPKIINLMDALKKSVAEAQSAGKKVAPSATEAGEPERKKTG